MGSFFDFNFRGVKTLFNIRFFIVLVLIFAIIFITIGLTKANYKCPPNQIKYVYIPRTFEEQQNNPATPSEIFSKLFDEPSPWISSFVGTESTNIADGFSSQTASTFDYESQVPATLP